MEEQGKYIAILEEQVGKTMQSSREKVSHQQYDTVINQLLQENTRLHQQLQKARDDGEEWRKQARQLWMEAEAKPRIATVTTATIADKAHQEKSRQK